MFRFSMENMKLSVVIPVYNEEKTIGKVLSKIPKEHEIIVVDDGSTDNSYKIAKSFGAKVIRHNKNLGYDRAIRTGIENSKTDVIVTLDADGEHNPKEIPKLIKKLKHVDIVLGERETLPRFSEKLIAWLVRRRIKNIRDATTGFRAIKKSAMDKINTKNMGFGANMVLQAKKNKLKIGFVKVSSIRRKHPRIKTLKIIKFIFSLIKNVIWF